MTKQNLFVTQIWRLRRSRATFSLTGLKVSNTAYFLFAKIDYSEPVEEVKSGEFTPEDAVKMGGKKLSARIGENRFY